MQSDDKHPLTGLPKTRLYPARLLVSTLDTHGNLIHPQDIVGPILKAEASGKSLTALAVYRHPIWGWADAIGGGHRFDFFWVDLTFEFPAFVEYPNLLALSEADNLLRGLGIVPLKYALTPNVAPPN